MRWDGMYLNASRGYPTTVAAFDWTYRVEYVTRGPRLSNLSSSPFANLDGTKVRCFRYTIWRMGHHCYIGVSSNGVND